MDHQTQVSERNGVPQKAPNALARDVDEFAHDVLTLAELQAQLFVTDLQDCGQRVFVPSLVLLCGVALGLACFPVALAALALLLIQLGTSYAAGFLVAVGVGTVLSALLCVIGWSQVRKRLAVMHARYLSRQLCSRLPVAKLIVGLWDANGDLKKARERIGCDAIVVATLTAAQEQIGTLIQPNVPRPHTPTPSQRGPTVMAGK